MNETIENNSWINKNRIWLFPIILLITAAFIWLSNSKLGDNVGDVAKAYADVELHKKAIEIAQANEEVKTLLGNLEPLDQFAIMEGSVSYSEDNKFVELHCRLKGSKENGKIDIFANRNNNAWEYDKINIRLLKPKRTIEVLEH